MVQSLGLMCLSYPHVSSCMRAHEKINFQNYDLIYLIDSCLCDLSMSTYRSYGKDFLNMLFIKVEVSRWFYAF